MMITVWILLVALVFLVAGGLCSDRINSVLCRYFPGASFWGDDSLLWGMLILTAVALGLVVWYLVSSP